MIRTYSQMISLPTYEERLEYLRLGSVVSELVFSGHRYLNQALYKSPEWKRARRNVIARDNGCDLAIPDRQIFDRIYIHHIEPLRIDDLLEGSDKVFNEDNLVCVSFDTHQMIHYGRKERNTLALPSERSRNDMAPWK